jgi:hypothetical protein
MKIIGITGKAGSGKDTFARYMQTRLAVLLGDGSFPPIESFAYPIKAGVSTMFSIPMESLEARSEKEEIKVFGDNTKASPRVLMQTLGTEWGRNVVSEDIWIDLLRSRIETCYLSAPTAVIITDVRFKNEAEWIKDQGGTLIEIARKGLKGSGIHSSEDGVDLIPDYTVFNSSSLSDLENVALYLSHILFTPSKPNSLWVKGGSVEAGAKEVPNA